MERMQKDMIRIIGNALMQRLRYTFWVVVEADEKQGGCQRLQAEGLRGEREDKNGIMGLL